ncbi:MAG: CHAT domain-containing protein [Calditrichaeota bacterium]|nr:CHAT domain-containing protein [Calditrichota bacterium]
MMKNSLRILFFSAVLACTTPLLAQLPLGAYHSLPPLPSQPWQSLLQEGLNALDRGDTSSAFRPLRRVLPALLLGGQDEYLREVYPFLIRTLTRQKADAQLDSLLRLGIGLARPGRGIATEPASLAEQQLERLYRLRHRPRDLSLFFRQGFEAGSPQAATALGDLLAENGRRAGADSVLGGALERAREMGDSAGMINLLTQRAKLRCRENLPQQGREMLNQAQQLWFSSAGTLPPSLLAGVYRQLGAALQLQGDFFGAIDYLKKALALADLRQERDSGPGNLRADILLDLAGNLTSAERLRGAGRSFEQARAAFPRTLWWQDRGTFAPHYFAVLTDLNLARGLPGAAATALDSLTANAGRFIFEPARIELLLPRQARFLLLAGLADSARVLLENHLAGPQARPADNPVFSAHLYRLLGESYLALNLADPAVCAFQDGLALLAGSPARLDLRGNPRPQETVDPVEAMRLLSRKAMALNQRYFSFRPDRRDLLAALAAMDRLEDFLDEQRRGEMSTESKINLGREFVPARQIAIQTALQLYELSGDISYYRRTFTSIDNCKSAVLFAAVSLGEAQRRAGVPDSLRAREAELRQAVIDAELALRIGEQSQTAAGDYPAVAWEAYLQHKRRHQAFVEALESRYPGIQAMRYNGRAVSLEILQSSLDLRTTVINYLVSGENLYAAVINRDAYRLFALPFGAEALQLLEGWSGSIRKVSAQRDFITKGYSLHQVLLGPLVESGLLREKLVILPDGPLYQIPFEALLTDLPDDFRTRTGFARLPYLLRRHEISYHYSATLFSHLAQRKPGPERLSWAGFAPVFDEAASPFARLPFSELEVLDIARLFEDKGLRAEAFLYQKASEENFRKYCGEFGILHIASHGFVNQENPELSGIAFAAPAGTPGAGDGILFEAESAGLDLHCDLMVLSSCESGAGRAVSGEGSLSLTRGFLSGGVNNIIVSLWQVNDMQTGRLMSTFYPALLQGHGYAESLRRAKLKMLDNPGSALPYFWSPFVLFGR